MRPSASASPRPPREAGSPMSTDSPCPRRGATASSCRSSSMARSSSRRVPAALFAVAAVLIGPLRVQAQGIDITLFGGLAYPLYDERLTLSPANPSIPGVEITSLSTPVLSADGGAVAGGAVALEFGILALEGRLDSVEAGLEFSGARYDLRGTAFPFQGLTASIVASSGRFDAERISLLSLNARIRTPGPIGI